MLRLGRFVFRFRMVPTLVTLLLLPILVSLGLWQLERAEEKAGLLETHAYWASGPPLKLDGSVTDPRSLHLRRVLLTGSYDNHHQFLLDNQVHNGRVGYQVLTPLRFDQGGAAVLVNRGWVPAPEYRHQLPDVAAPDEGVTVKGLVALPYKPALVRGTAATGNIWPRVIQYVDIDQFTALSELKLLPVVVLMEPGETHGYVREWKTVSMPPEKHEAYAFQWFSLALVLCIIYIGVNLRRVKH